MDKIRVIDATLREGNQAPGVKFNLNQAKDIAKLLAAVGIDMIECGHAFASADDAARISAIADLGLPVPLLSHARARQEDIDAAAAAGADWIGIFCGINRISRMSRLRGRSVESVMDVIRRSVGKAKANGLGVRYTLEDASRTSLEVVIDVFRAAIAEGADRVCYADTLGALTPAGFSEVIRQIKAALPDADLEVHVHDDRGFAMANAWCGMEAGASWISTSVNGLGERCGVTDLSVLLANLDHAGLRPLHTPELLQELSRYVGAVSRSPPDHRRPIVGRNAFTHTSKLHTQAMKQTPLAYAVFEAERFGRAIEMASPARQRTLLERLVKPEIIPATELKYHRIGPGSRHVMIDERFVDDARQYCIVREIFFQAQPPAAHIDPHRHICDSLFIFLGKEPGLAGLNVEVMLDGEIRDVSSPAAMFIPAGSIHSYRVLGGEGYYINHVANGEYNGSLLEPVDVSIHGETLARVDCVDFHARDALRTFLSTSAGVPRSALGDQMDLLESGVLDSLGFLQLFCFIEEYLGVTIPSDAFDSISNWTIAGISENLDQWTGRPGTSVAAGRDAAASAGL
ncbi:UNVERIFIED_ORG: hypothetical protein BTE55_09855 [Rhizobium sophorae]